MAIALGSGWLADARREGGLTVQADMMERRLEAMERRCMDR